MSAAPSLADMRLVRNLALLIGPGRIVASPSASKGGDEATEGGEMLLATTKVEDIDRWLKIFSTTAAEKRKQHGSKGSHAFRDPNEEDRVWVLFDWDAEGWQSFVSDPEVPPILKEAGHKIRPEAAEFLGQYEA
jgi:hypothetical protein